MKIIDNDDIKLPKSDKLTFENSYYNWITSIFVDIKNLTNLIEYNDNIIVSKIIKSFVSEVIEILRDDDNCREIGIREDCVYGIYTTPLIEDIFSIFIHGCCINTFIQMENKLLDLNNFNTKINIGIGLGTSKVLTVKVGRKYVGINDKIWIGDAVVDASNLASIADKNKHESILLSSSAYHFITEHNHNIICNKRFHEKYNNYYSCNYQLAGFSDLINNL